jgi:hypothetical protein
MNTICNGLNCSSTDLINAHIIPAGFGRIIRGDGPNMSLSITEAIQANPQLGEFDKTILCRDCDRKIGLLDEYAIEVCAKFDKRHRRTGPDTFEIPNFEGEKFAKFVLAVLWRASISNRKTFSQIKLGPYQDLARDIIFDAHPMKSLPAFKVLLARYTSKYLDMKGIYTIPTTTKYDGLRFYWFMLTGFRVMAKLDNRPLKSTVESLAINDSTSAIGPFLEFEQTPEFEGVKDITVRDMLRNKSI